MWEVRMRCSVCVLSSSCLVGCLWLLFLLWLLCMVVGVFVQVASQKGPGWFVGRLVTGLLVIF